jgi:hypothetical protein
MTHFGDLGSDNVGTRDNILEPGDIAVGHRGKNPFPKKTDPWVLPFGTDVTVVPDGEDGFDGEVARWQMLGPMIKNTPTRPSLKIG